MGRGGCDGRGRELRGRGEGREARRGAGDRGRGDGGRMLPEDRRTDGGNSIGATWPTIVESTVMAARAPTAPNQTVKRGWRMDMMAAMKKVLSPSSVPKITPMEAVNASANPAIPKVAAATTVSSASAIGRSASATAPSVLLCIVLATPPTPRGRRARTLARAADAATGFSVPLVITPRSAKRAACSSTTMTGPI